jgi:hypothetical protein
MRQGLAEWAVVTAVLVLVAAGAAVRWREPIRAAFGVRPAAAATRGPAPGSP